MIAKHTSNLAECQQKCRDIDDTCSWSIGGVAMNNCRECPDGCDARDGVQECLSGCAHAQDGVYLYEANGNGKLFLPRSKFAANQHSGRGGAAAWDACGGDSFDNGHPVWKEGPGSFVGSFQVVGNWTLRAADRCALHFDYSSVTMSQAYTAADGVVSTELKVIYLEAAQSLVV